uniref:Uncharacterized protein LOC114344311 n=1 Tax=Diabrotica virgifera virgifera TaxID=50390 RepID=A0A6P7H4M0_DIAVI
MDTFLVSPVDNIAEQADRPIVKIRQLTDPSLTTDEAKIVLLRGALKQASANRSHAVLSSFPLKFGDEVREIEVTIADLKAQISSFVGSHNVLYGRLTSRLGHVAGRVHLLESVTEEEDAIKKSLNFKILNLEGELEFKVTPQAHSTPHNASVSVNSFPFIRSAPIHKWGVRFSGGSDENVVSFLEKVECLRLARGNSEDECFSSAGDLFKDSAFTWYLNNRGSFTSWQQLVAKLRSDFLPYNYEDSLLDEIKSRKQAPQEKVTIFINEIVSLCKRLETPLSESHIVRIINRNLLPSYHSSLALTDISSIADLTQKCKKLEEVLSWSSDTASSVPSRSNFKNHESSYSCRQNYPSIADVTQKCKIILGLVTYLPLIRRLSVGTVVSKDTGTTTVLSLEFGFAMDVDVKGSVNSNANSVRETREGVDRPWQPPLIKIQGILPKILKTKETILGLNVNDEDAQIESQQDVEMP